MNKRGSGFYNTPLQHFIRTSVAKDTYGGTDWVWTADGNTYFGNVQQTTSQETDEYGRILTRTNATIRVRGWFLPISPLDRLLDLQWNEEYYVDSIARGEDEFILECHHV